MVGDSGVGKTNLLRQHVNNQFTDTHLPTIGIEFGLTHHTVDGNTAASAVIWDTSGSERFGRGFRSSYLRCSHGVMLVYDATSRSTFESLRKELEQVRENVYHDAVIMLVGNKMDLESDRAVSALEGADFAGMYDCILEFREGDYADFACSAAGYAVYRGVG